MALGDAQYQINDLTARIKVLENNLKAVNPGNQPSVGPAHPLGVVTSVGQTGTADSDNYSRALNTALQAGFSGIESLQFVQTQFGMSFFTSGIPSNIFSFNIRPDPAVGDVYRVTFAGVLSNASGAPMGFNIFVSLPGSSLVSLLQPIKPSGVSDAYFCQFLLVCVAAGLTAGNVHLMSNATAGFFGTGTINPPQNFAFAAGMGGAINLVSPILLIQATSSASDPSIAMNIEFLTVEFLGSRTG